MSELIPDVELVLDFENQAFIELLSEDGLIIMARGLGLDQLFLKFLKLYCDPHNLVLVLNTSVAYEKYFIEELTREGIEHLPKSVTNEFSSKEREALYLQGGVLFITSRILVVDILRKQCPIDNVTGLLVYNGHRVKDSSTEAFILTLYRQKNKVGFIKAFSDAPEPFTNGFCVLERVMRNIFVRNVYLWPRFHATVSASLTRHKPDVVELRQQMTPSMMAVQMAILDIMKTCVSELRRSNPSLDTEEVTVENCMSKSFNQIIKMQLDPVWNQLGGKTKQLVFDLRTLQTLLYFLTQYDCVTFFKYLESIKSGGDMYALGSHSSWVFMDSATTLFVKARERVFGRSNNGRDNKPQQGSDEKKREPFLSLEESPKWHLLSMVLEEIQKETKSNTQIESNCKVLVVTHDDRTCYHLRQYLCEGGRKLLQDQFNRLTSANLTGGMQWQTGQTADKNVSKGKGQKRSVRDDIQGTSSKKRKFETDSKESESEEMCSESEANLLGGATYSEFIQEDVNDFEMIFDEVLEPDEQSGMLRPSSSHFGLLSEPVIILHALSSSDNPYHMTKLLRELRPRFIVLYDADVQFIRQVEVFKACNPGMPLRVYFLLYDSSVEEQKYLTALRKEKDAFQQLIKERAHMVVPVDREGKVGDSSLLRRESSSMVTQSVSSRKAGGRIEDKGPQKVLVDIREFRSTLPSLIHRQGMDIDPFTLEVGDYILSPDLCVERKSVSDLIGSLNSGRLYNQATAMTRHYKKPILLIEFDENKSFSLQSSSLRSDISSQDVASKLVLLTLHFPSLRILWCSSPYATAELFEQLKLDQPQPESEVALAIGQDTLDKVEGITYSALIQDFLLKLPGISSKNYRSVMNRVHDLQELVLLSEKDLEETLGNNANAKLLWTFLHTEFKVTTRNKPRVKH